MLTDQSTDDQVAAVTAIHPGDLATLNRLLTGNPGLPVNKQPVEDDRHQTAHDTLCVHSANTRTGPQIPVARHGRTAPIQKCDAAFFLRSSSTGISRPDRLSSRRRETTMVCASRSNPGPEPATGSPSALQPAAACHGDSAQHVVYHFCIRVAVLAGGRPRHGVTIRTRWLDRPPPETSDD